MNPSSSSDHRGSESPGETPVFLSEREPGSTGAQRLPCSVEWRTYTPTEEENKIFRECGSESFFSRCLPMALLGLIIIPIIFPKGSRFASSRVGLVPEIMLFGAVSYIVGQYSYLNACKEKFMNLRDSPIGKSLRQPHTEEEQVWRFMGGVNRDLQSVQSVNAVTERQKYRDMF
ncbi:OCIA domain-containing protein 1 isoform X2 [Astyanax mexicanus]|uniref:OCIA domain-containing protein 1 isoform X2 n=1 Tax=Astyanax mexicanus TaxID=7994 RepID=UPI0020CB51E8|nr:OCIA domain-containing protein 1 isoform X2 [Astyanax mexicanus]